MIIAVALLIVGWYIFCRYQRTRVARGAVPATKLERQVRIMLGTRIGRDEEAVAKVFSEYAYSLRLRKQRLLAEGLPRNAPELAIIEQLYHRFPKWCADAVTAAAMSRMDRSGF